MNYNIALLCFIGVLCVSCSTTSMQSCENETVRLAPYSDEYVWAEYSLSVGEMVGSGLLVTLVSVNQDGSAQVYVSGDAEPREVTIKLGLEIDRSVPSCMYVVKADYNNQTAIIRFLVGK